LEVAPGTMPPEVSTTAMAIWPVEVCARTETEMIISHRKSDACFMTAPLVAADYTPSARSARNPTEELNRMGLAAKIGTPRSTGQSLGQEDSSRRAA
jgi:hypothetical protein